MGQASQAAEGPERMLRYGAVEPSIQGSELMAGAGTHNTKTATPGCLPAEPFACHRMQLPPSGPAAHLQRGQAAGGAARFDAYALQRTLPHRPRPVQLLQAECKRQGSDCQAEQTGAAAQLGCGPPAQCCLAGCIA